LPISNTTLSGISSPYPPPHPKPILTIRDSEADTHSPVSKCSPSNSHTSVATPKSVKFCDEPPTKFSPVALKETTPEDRIELLLQKISNMRKASEADAEPSLSQSDCSFSLPSSLNIPALPASPKLSSPICNNKVAVNSDAHYVDQDSSFLANQCGDLETTNQASQDLEHPMKSILMSQGGDLLRAAEAPSIVEDTCMVTTNMTSENLSHLVLQHEAKLLEKDKQLAGIGQQILEKQGEVERLRWEVATSEENNGQMMGIMGEFENTIQQLIMEKERDGVSLQIKREKAEKERDQILDDLQAVERAFKDLHKKYERTKEVINVFKSNEDALKSRVTDLCTRYKKGEERYELLKTHAETKLEEANTRLGEVKQSKAAEIAKLKAMLRKAEMGVSSLEKQAEQKSRENEELTAICDQLISKVGK